MRTKNFHNAKFKNEENKLPHQGSCPNLQFKERVRNLKLMFLKFCMSIKIIIVTLFCTILLFNAKRSYSWKRDLECSILNQFFSFNFDAKAMQFTAVDAAGLAQQLLLLFDIFSFELFLSYLNIFEKWHDVFFSKIGE